MISNPELLLSLEPDKSWLSLDKERIIARFRAWFTVWSFYAVGFDFAQEFSKKSVDQIQTEYSDKDEFFKPILCNLPKISRELITSDIEGITIKDIAVSIYDKGEFDRAADFIHEFIEKRDELERLERVEKYKEAEALSNIGKKGGSKPKIISGVALFTEEQLDRNPKITTPQLLAKIKTAQGSEHIFCVEDGVIQCKNYDKDGEQTDKGTTEVEVKNLRQFLYRIRKKRLKKN